jgi:DNA gyrase subunit A
VIRTSAREVRKAKRQTMGVRLMNLSEGDSLVAIARNADAAADAAVDAAVEGEGPSGPDGSTDGGA